MNFSNELLRLAAEAESRLADEFRKTEAIAQINTERVLNAFSKFRVSDSLFAGTSGYGYDDRGREVLEQVYAELFGCEKALVRHSILSGTHALAIGLFGLLRPGDILLSVTGKPYDTLDDVIGLSEESGNGSLKDFGVEYRQVDLTPNSTIDLAAVADEIRKEKQKIRVVYLQRSKGYLNRKTLTLAQLRHAIREIRNMTDAYIVIDNCYGEFVGTAEPTSFGADLCIGSLIKNPGGGFAESGGYLCGSAKAVELASYRYTSPGVGAEVGATLGQNKNMFRGLFYAPHTVCQAVKTAQFAAYLFAALGYPTEPVWNEERSDIIQKVELGSAEKLCAFCAGIQHGSPVDAFVTPEPWDMPGYHDPVIMAAGTFVQGASIELSADGPIRPPYLAFFQGGLTYESGKIGILTAAQEILNLQ